MEAAFEWEVIKVTGAPTENFWSANFAEIPVDAEKLSFRGQLFLVIYLNSSQKNLAEVGHKFWVNLVGNFYGNLEGGVLTVLQQVADEALAKLSQEATFEEIGFVAAAFWGKILYLVQAGKAAAGVVRAGKFSIILAESAEIPPNTTSASGFLEDSDLVFLATSDFFQSFSNLEEFFGKESSEIEEELASEIGLAEKAARMAAQIFKIKEAKVPEPAEVVTFAQSLEAGKISSFKSRLATILSRLPGQQLSQFWVKLFSTIFAPFKIFFKREIYLTTKSREFFRKNFFKLVFSILVLILIVSLSIGIWQRQRRVNFEKFQKHFASAQSFYEEAVAVSSLNRLRARELLTASQKDIDFAKKLKFEKEKVGQLAEKINLANLQSLKLIKVDNPVLVFDLSLVKTGAAVSEIEKPENILAYDKTGTNLFLLEIERKTGQILAGGANFSGFANFTAAGSLAYFFKAGDGIYQFNLASQEIKKVIEQDQSWGEILDLTSFGGNLYLLDGKLGQIWKYIPTADGFSTVRGFLQEAGKLDFSATSFSIDGFIWVLARGGQLYQTTPAEAKLIEISGLDKPLSTKTILRTNADAANLYIGDLGNSRILVLSKTGLYLAQYSSGVFAQISDFSVDELSGKIYFAQGSKVFQFDLVK